jgi:pimeloyl-ACP methyl ester carboxylesterase
VICRSSSSTAFPKPQLFGTTFAPSSGAPTRSRSRFRASAARALRAFPPRQTAGAGEQWFRDQFALPIDERAATFERFGVPRGRARDLAAGMDPTMGECILALYRSALDVGREWAPAIRNIRTPGLVVVATDDPFVTNPGGAERTAAACGAKTERLEGLGHCWALQDPKRSADVLARFWASLG